MPAPPANVLRAFADGAAAAPVGGGQGTTYRAGNVALKPCDEREETEWLGSVLAEIEENGFRIARPIRAVGAGFVVDGWCASRWVDGDPNLHGHWDEAIAALRSFNRALRDVRRPELFDRRTNAYALADRMTWGETPMHPAGALGDVAERLVSKLRPVNVPSQLIQGDPSEGNLLFADGLPPAAIDVAPYWRPAEYTVALFIADAIAWSSAPHELLDVVRHEPEMDQLLARAVLFRLIIAKLFRGGAGIAKHAAAYEPIIKATIG